MTFTRLKDISPYRITCFRFAADDVRYAIGRSLVLEMGGGRFVREGILYHAALAHASNHIVTVLWPMRSERCGPPGGNCSANKPSTTSRAGSLERIVGRWPNGAQGARKEACATGPVARGWIIWRPSRTTHTELADRAAHAGCRRVLTA